MGGGDGSIDLGRRSDCRNGGRLSIRRIEDLRTAVCREKFTGDEMADVLHSLLPDCAAMRLRARAASTCVLFPPRSKPFFVRYVNSDTPYNLVRERLECTSFARTMTV